jgi:hypothetical protein
MRSHTAAAARKQAALRPSALEVFSARAEARALLWQAGQLDLHDAVDELQHTAVRDGLVAELGQDAVQEIMVAAFTTVREPLRPPGVEVNTDDNWQTLGQSAARVVEKLAAATIMAAEYLVQQGDAERLRNWLDRHSADERTAIRRHLEAKRCRSHPNK